MNRFASNLAQKFQELSPEQITAVEDFIEFLRARGPGRSLTRAASAATVLAFDSIWNNPEDDIYDAL